MAFGTHSFYTKKHCGDYYLGSITGDHYACDEFANRLKRVLKKLELKFGIAGFVYYWSPPYREVKRLTDEQKYKRAVSKSYNKHKASVLEILNSNVLFADQFLKEEEIKIHNRIEVLKKRYNQ